MIRTAPPRKRRAGAFSPSATRAGQVLQFPAQPVPVPLRTLEGFPWRQRDVDFGEAAGRGCIHGRNDLWNVQPHKRPGGVAENRALLSKRTRVRQIARPSWHRRRRSAAGGKFQNSLDLFAGYVVVFDDLFDGGPVLEISKMTEIGMRVSRRTQAPLTRPGTLSTAGHWDQSSAAVAIGRPPLFPHYRIPGDLSRKSSRRERSSGHPLHLSLQGQSQAVAGTPLRRHVAMLWECTGCSARHPWILRQPGSPTPLVPPRDDARQFPKTGR